MNWTHLGGRKFVLAMGCGAVTSLLTYLGKIDGSIYATVILGTVGSFIAGNVTQSVKQGKTE